jgi:cytochrome c oxidase subunit 1
MSEAIRRVRDDAGTYRGFWSWIATVDHKRIGIMYGVTTLLFFCIGGIEALAIRTQLARPENDFISPDHYNRIFTMHGTTMVFLVVMPLGLSVFGNLLVPLMIGARDMAFPRLNAFSYWVFLFGGLFLYSSMPLGGNVLKGDFGGPDTGWYGYAPLTLDRFSPGHGVDFWAIGLQILGISTIAGSLNLIVTILNMRAPGMSLFRMPPFVWMTLVTAFLAIFALVVIGAGLWELTFDRLYHTNFFNAGKGGTPLLWQHMFWIFGHPEVYIMILPAMGIVSEILPVFSRKPLFGYPFVVFSGIAIGFMSWGVWAHHMYVTGLGSVANSAFGISTILIAVPTGVKIFNWLATMWGGQIRLTSAMYFAIGFIAMFTIGGLTGVTHSIVPTDYQQNDTYYIVSHLHQVLFGGAIFGLFAGAYYWFPKFTGRFLNEKLGKLHFWLMLIGFNLAFQPMMILGLLGMPRRIHDYPNDYGWGFWNAMSTAGAFVIATSILVFVINFIMSARSGEIAGADPWDGRTIEWMTDSPPPPHNFDEIPRVRTLDEFWHRKYAETTEGAPLPVPAGAQEHPTVDPVLEAQTFHLPSPSYFPLIASLGFPVIGYGLIYHPALVAVGVLTLLVGIYGWALEPAIEPHAGDLHAID